MGFFTCSDQQKNQVIRPRPAGHPVGAQSRGWGQSGVSISHRRGKPGVWYKGLRSQGLLHTLGAPSSGASPPLPAPPWPSASPRRQLSADPARRAAILARPKTPRGPGSFKRKMNVSYQQLEEIISDRNLVSLSPHPCFPIPSL